MNTTEPKHIAIQGYPGAFHDMAARQYFNGQSISILPADTFEDVVAAVEENNVVDAGMMAIENSIAGSLLPNYNLLHHSPVRICGEIYLRIKQNLMALPGSSIHDLEEVHSHYMAIAQSKEYFLNYPHIKLVETIDTAESARQIARNELKNTGAIASQLASQLYN